MAIKISQFHPRRDRKRRLDKVCCSTEVYLDAKYGLKDPRPTNWVRVSEDPTLPLQHLPFRKKFGRLQCIQLHDDLPNEFVGVRELVQLLVGDRVVAEHEYQVVSNPYFTRNPRLDKEYEPTSDFATPDPPGTESEFVEGYEVMLLDRSMSGSGIGFNTGSLAALFGLQMGIDFRAESSHEEEKREKRTQLQRKTQVVPENQYAMQTLTTFRYDLGFTCYRTGNDGATWVAMDLRIPVELWAWHRVYSTKKRGPKKCFESMANDVANVLSPLVKRWLSSKLGQAGLAGLQC